MPLHQIHWTYLLLSYLQPIRAFISHFWKQIITTATTSLLAVGGTIALVKSGIVTATSGLFTHVIDRTKGKRSQKESCADELVKIQMTLVSQELALVHFRHDTEDALEKKSIRQTFPLYHYKAYFVKISSWIFDVPHLTRHKISIRHIFHFLKDIEYYNHMYAYMIEQLDMINHLIKKAEEISLTENSDTHAKPLREAAQEKLRTLLKKIEKYAAILPELYYQIGHYLHWLDAKGSIPWHEMDKTR